MPTEQPDQNRAEDAFFDNKDVGRQQVSELPMVEIGDRVIDGKRDQFQRDSELLNSLIEEDDGHRKLIELSISEGKDRFEELITVAVDCGVPEQTKDRYFDLFAKTCQELQDTFERYEVGVDQAIQAANLAEPWSKEHSEAFGRASGLSSKRRVLAELIPKAEQAAAQLEYVPDHDSEDHDIVKERLGVDTEKLFEEKALLEQRYSFYKEVVKRVLFREEGFNSVELKVVFDRVIEKLRAETDIMEASDTEGVDLFVEDLRNQPNFPELSAIKFGRNPAELSTEKKQLLRAARTPEDVQNLVKEDGIVCDDIKDLRYLQHYTDRPAGGSYAHGSRRIYVLQNQPSLDLRRRSFLVSGGISGASSTLVHEIRHHRQMSLGASNDSDGGKALMEAQSYVQHSLSNFSERMLDVVRTLTRRDGSYQVPVDVAVQAIEFVERLNAMGIAQEEISQIIAKASWDEEKQKFTNLDILLKEKMKELQVGEADVDQLRDVFRVLRRVKQLRIQDIARQELFADISEDAMREYTKIADTSAVPLSILEGKRSWAGEPSLALLRAEDSTIFKRDGYTISFGSDGELKARKLNIENDKDGKTTKFELKDTLDDQEADGLSAVSPLHEALELLKSMGKRAVEDALSWQCNLAQTDKDAESCLALHARLEPFLS